MFIWKWICFIQNWASKFKFIFATLKFTNWCITLRTFSIANFIQNLFKIFCRIIDCKCCGGGFPNWLNVLNLPFIKVVMIKSPIISIIYYKLFPIENMATMWILPWVKLLCFKELFLRPIYYIWSKCMINIKNFGIWCTKSGKKFFLS